MSSLSNDGADLAFRPILELIGEARRRVARTLNSALVDLYLEIGREIDRRVKEAGWGRGTIESLSAAIRALHPSARGFSPQNLWRRRHFYEVACASGR